MMGETDFLSKRAIRVTGTLLMVAGLSACAEGPDFSFLQPKDTSESKASALSQPQKSAKLIEEDVEAPDVFSASEAGLWDGRPSLGGVWVAHPDVKDPERVIIRNTANNKTVIGALFRREREIPGPRVQASSDAAEALGMLAGAPVNLSVVALRRQEVEPEPAVVAEEPTGSVPDAPEIAETSLDPIAGGAAAAIAASEPVKEEVETELAEAPAPSDATSDIDAAVEQAVTEEKPARKGWFGSKLFAGNRDNGDKGLKLFGRNKEVGEPLSALKPEPIEVAAATPVATQALPTPAPRAKPRPSSLKKPFIQIGIFSVESNAKGTADLMRSSGIVPTIYEQSSNGKAFWRVVVGPARSSAERASLLKKIKGVGFTDAYAVTN